MKDYHFYSLQANIMIVAALVAHSQIAKGIFLLLAFGNFWMMFKSARTQ